MADVALNYRYLHNKVHDFMHGVIDDIRDMSPSDRAITTWHLDLGNVSDGVFVSLIAWFNAESLKEYFDDQVEAINKNNIPSVFIYDDDVYILQFEIRRTTTSAMQEEYDYSPVCLKNGEYLCEGCSVYDTDDDTLSNYECVIVDDISNVNNHSLDELQTGDYDLV